MKYLMMISESKKEDSMKYLMIISEMSKKKKEKKQLTKDYTWCQVSKSHRVYDSSYMKRPEQTNAERQKVDEWLPGSGGSGGWCATATGYGAFFRGDGNILSVVMIVQLCEYS